MPEVKFQYQFVVDDNAPEQIKKYVPIIFCAETSKIARALLQLNQEYISFDKVMSEDSNVKLSVLESIDLKAIKCDIVKIQYGDEYMIMASTHCQKKDKDEDLDALLHSSKKFNSTIGKYKDHINEYLNRMEYMSGLIDDGTINPMTYVTARIIPQFTLCSKGPLTEESKREIAARMLSVQINADFHQLMTYGYKASKRSFTNKYLPKPIDERIKITNVELVEHPTTNVIAIFHSLEIEGTYYYGGHFAMAPLKKGPMDPKLALKWFDGCLNKRMEHMRLEGIDVIPLKYMAPPKNN